ncbi:MAG: glycosyltransferase family 4 protein [Ornithinimicrobium sp.]
MTPQTTTTVTPALPEGRQHLRILIAYSYSMHYRLGVFRALLDHPDVDVTIAAGNTAPATRFWARGATAGTPIEAADLPELQWHRTIPLGPVVFQPGLLRRSLSSRYDVVVWDPSMHCLTMWLSSLVIRARGQSLVYWGLGWTKPHGPVKERLKVAGFALAHGFLAYGRRSAELGIAAGYPARRLHVVGNSLPDSEAARGVAAADFAPTDPLVLGVALRLTARKRVDLLLQAVAELNARGVPTRAIIVGDGEQADALRRLAAELGVDAEFTGALYEAEQIAAYYEQIHLSVIPGHAGLTVLGSLMHGRPVITHDNPEHHAAEWEAIRPGVSGAFFAESDVAALVEAILQMREPLLAGPDARRRVSQACRADYREHGLPQAHAQRVIGAVQDVVTSRLGQALQR